MALRSVKIKRYLQGQGEIASGSFLTESSAPIGVFGGQRVVEIRDIPASVSNTEVLSVWRHTIDCTYLDTPDSSYPRHSYAWTEIGRGVILRGKAAV
jgi:hypothetical protein